MSEMHILSPEKVDEIAKRRAYAYPNGMVVRLTTTERDALCQTVRALRQALRDHGEHESHCKSNERYPSPKCDCVLAQYLYHQGA